jgi:catechol 2,3-dioxygenase-like lactoylglutathione lyase family enzyme
MAGVKLIHHVNVQISNRERTREWYEKVLGAEFLDRGQLNQRQLQLRIGAGEMHFTETPNPVSTGHFAVEVDNWEEMLANLDRLGVTYSRSGGTFTNPPRTPQDDDRQGRREDNGEHYTYIHDPDGNMIELVYHPLGLEDSRGNQIELPDSSRRLRWKQKEGFATSMKEEGR